MVPAAADRLLDGGQVSGARARAAAAVWLPTVALAAGVLSLIRTGFRFGLGNNEFHIPIVLRFDQLPQFADDALIASLRHFVSPLYPLLSLLASESDVEFWFFLLLGATHALTWLALLLIARACGVESLRGQVIVAGLLVAARNVYWTSPVGSDALFVDTFSHSELARAMALLALAGALRNRLVLASACGGLAFALNAFIGVWTLALLTVVFGSRYAVDRATADWRTLCAAALAFALPAVPVAAWIALSVGSGKLDFDYGTYLWQYFPNHFFIEAASPSALVKLAAAVLAGLLAATRLGCLKTAGAALYALLGVFAIGILVGHLTTSRLLLNLHLLRVDGMLTLLAAVLVASAVARDLGRGRVWDVAAAGLASLGLLVGSWPLVAVAMGLSCWLARRPDAPRRLPEPLQALLRPGLVGFAAMLVATGLGIGTAAYAWSLRRHVTPVPTDRELVGSNAPAREWIAVQQWARTATSPTSLFLVPTNLPDFRTGSQRRSWVGWKEGAMAMWAPDAYPQWRERMSDVERLPTGLAASVAYACDHAIDYVVMDLRPRGGVAYAPQNAVFLDRWFEVHKTECAHP